VVAVAEEAAVDMAVVDMAVVDTAAVDTVAEVTTASDAVLATAMVLAMVAGAAAVGVGAMTTTPVMTPLWSSITHVNKIVSIGRKSRTEDARACGLKTLSATTLGTNSAG
jgi:hypothetical protein